MIKRQIESGTWYTVNVCIVMNQMNRFDYSEKELEAVKVKKEDIVFISREMEITSQQAERKLREADGDMSKCLHTMLCA